MLTSAELVWLVATVAKDDDVAFERLYSATCSQLYGIIRRILRRQDLADQVMQSTYVEIWHRAGEFDPALSLPITWMASIARNRAIDVARRMSDIPIEDGAATIETPRTTPISRRDMTEGLRRLLECMGRLEPSCQKLVLLAYFDGLSREQLAEKFASPVSMVKSWLRRSMLDIREYLEA